AAFCVAKLGNRPAITCVPRLERDNFSHSAEPCLIQSEVPLLSGVGAGGLQKQRAAEEMGGCEFVDAIRLYL
ncbi:MAG: hypothetical protein KDI89_15050, partial [Gammaproteobacteria bacterium]|nr:hypothetical protein [Gammaproteobacteria bacterium]